MQLSVVLTHWWLNKLNAILQMTFSSAFSQTKVLHFDSNSTKVFLFFSFVKKSSLVWIINGLVAKSMKPLPKPTVNSSRSLYLQTNEQIFIGRIISMDCHPYSVMNHNTALMTIYHSLVWWRHFQWTNMWCFENPQSVHCSCEWFKWQIIVIMGKAIGNWDAQI